MSNRRRPARGNKYRTNYLHSGAWFARRDRWFLDEQTRNGEIRCALCLGAGGSHSLELHHLDYRGVTQTP
uniref:hypothetical protein n=1 Tax=Vibrio cidicii TaxID=1763883 RepID=UPI003703FA75